MAAKYRDPHNQAIFAQLTDIVIENSKLIKKITQMFSIKNYVGNHHGSLNKAIDFEEPE